MIVAQIKPLPEIAEGLEPHGKTLIVGCGGCTSICLAGGQPEVDQLCLELEQLFKEKGLNKTFEGYVVERGCDPDFIQELDILAAEFEAFLCVGCGAGAQLIAEQFPEKPVYPGVNTQFLGVNREVGWYEEKCRSCGDCQLAYTGCICPVTRCAKSIFNGPCGGTQREGRCELDAETPCAWVDIFNRLKTQQRVENIERIRQPTAWQNQKQGQLVHEAYRDRYTKKD